MRYSALATVLIGLSALSWSSCASTRQATSSQSEQLIVLSQESEQVRAESVEFRDGLNGERVELKDTLREVTTITVQTNRRTSERRGQAGLDYPEREGGKPKVDDKGDTLKVVQITDLTRARSRDNVVAQRVKTEVRVDTVYGEKRDSVYIQNTKLTNPTNATKSSGFRATLKWIFWIIIGLIGLIVTAKVCLLRR